MPDIWPTQTTDLNGSLRRIVYEESYLADREDSIPLPTSVIPSMDSTISPPLSHFEIADIEASEREFSTEEVRIYNNAEDLIRELRAARSRFQRENRE